MLLPVGELRVGIGGNGICYSLLLRIYLHKDDNAKGTLCGSLTAVSTMTDGSE